MCDTTQEHFRQVISSCNSMDGYVLVQHPQHGVFPARRPGFRVASGLIDGKPCCAIDLAELTVHPDGQLTERWGKTVSELYGYTFYP